MPFLLTPDLPSRRLALLAELWSHAPDLLQTRTLEELGELIARVKEANSVERLSDIIAGLSAPAKEPSDA